MKHCLLTLSLLCLVALCGKAQQALPFNGLLTDAAGKPVKRARVWAKSERDYALTDNKGQFGLTNIQPTDTLHLRIKKDEFHIPVSGRRSMRIQLSGSAQPQIEEDQQLVDLGFGFVSRREHTGVSNYISGDELRRSGQNDILSALQGRVPGLNVTGSNGMGGQNQQVNIRGERSFTADATPLFLIDSVVVPSFEGISLNDVDYVEVMKEASVYGSQGANGAIIVHTKTAAR